MNIEKYLKEKEGNFKKLELLSEERQKHADKLLETIHTWVYDLSIEKYLKPNKEKKQRIFGYLNTEIILSGIGCKIWIRRVLTKDQTLVLIGNSRLEYLDNIWYYIENDDKRQFSKDVFTEILIKEIENDYPDYY